MINWQTCIALRTRGRGTLPLASDLGEAIRASGVTTGVAHLFVQHTSASLLLTENADPDVHGDLERWLAGLAPDGDPRYRHDCEGPDDMAAHLRTVLLGASLTVPVTGGRLALGTWQGIYLYEHRALGHRRQVVVTVQGS